MPDPTDLFLKLMLVIGGGIAIAAFIRRRRDSFHVARRGRAQVSVKSLRATRDGEWAHVVGVAVGRETLTSPLTGRPCLGYRYVIEAYEEDGSVEVRAEDCVSFSLATDGIEAAVEGPFVFGCSLATVDREARSGLRDILRREGKAAWADRRDDRLSVREALLSANDQVAVVGQVSLEVHPQGERDSFRDPPTRRIVRGTSERPVLLADAFTPL